MDDEATMPVLAPAGERVHKDVTCTPPRSMASQAGRALVGGVRTVLLAIGRSVVLAFIIYGLGLGLLYTGISFYLGWQTHFIVAVLAAVIAIALHVAATLLVAPAYAFWAGIGGAIADLGLVRSVIQAGVEQAVRIRPSLAQYVVTEQLEPEAAEALREGMLAVEREVEAKLGRRLWRWIARRLFLAMIRAVLERLGMKIAAEGPVSFPSLAQVVGHQFDQAVGDAMSGSARKALVVVAIAEFAILGSIAGGLWAISTTGSPEPNTIPAAVSSERNDVD